MVQLVSPTAGPSLDEKTPPRDETDPPQDGVGPPRDGEELIVFKYRLDRAPSPNVAEVTAKVAGEPPQP